MSTSRGSGPQHFELNTPDATNYYITVRELDDWSIATSEKTDLVNDAALKKISHRARIKVNDVLFSSVGTVGRTALVTEAATNWGVKEGIYVLSFDVQRVEPKYAVHWLRSSQFRKKLFNLMDFGSMSSISMKKLQRISMPLPPIEVQRKIVTILDSFTDTERNLRREQALRQNQVEHYRNVLLNLDNRLESFSDTPRISLEEIAILVREKEDVEKFQTSNFTSVENLLPDKRGRVNAKKLPPQGRADVYERGDVLVGNIRPYLRKVWFADSTGGTNGDVLVFRARNDVSTPVLPEFLFQILASDPYFAFLQNNRKEGKMPRGDRAKALKFQITLPPVETQNAIVRDLGNFTSMEKVVEREIELCAKQLEYYRNQLLDFPIA
ncbi:restriction endonuclease subunit S [Corynebacterium sp. S7]